MKRLGVGAVIGLVVGLLVGGGAVWASIPSSSNGSVTACYPTSGPSKGALRVVDRQAYQVCAPGEAQVTLTSTTCSEFPHPYIDWHGCDFSQANLGSQNFTNANLQGTKLAGTSLRYARLNGANLTGANLRKSALGKAKFAGADVTGADFTGARLSGNFDNADVRTPLTGIVGFTNSQLRSLEPENYQGSTNCAHASGPALLSVSFDGVDVSTFDFTGTTLWNSSFNMSNLTSATFVGAYTYAAKFDNANLTNADFTCADLTLSSFPGAVLSGVTWSNTTCPDGTNSDNNGGTCIGHL